MRMAIREAKAAQRAGDYAVGAVIVRENEVIAACSNRSRRDESPIAHAEALAILEASQKFKRRHLPECVLYATHEPCPMCASLIVWAKLRGVIWGARIEDMRKYAEKNGSRNYLWRTIEISCEEVINKSTEEIEVIKDFMRKECVKLFHS